ncbi:MAG: DUF1573 domain-containing protein [Planctomycetota bacterium]|nr:DUF1573 domain-containing protein [Planctomycetota bacterium]
MFQRLDLRLILVVTCVLVTTADAQLFRSKRTRKTSKWAEKMFEQRRHSFGTVARAADARFAFRIRNVYRQPVRISKIKKSCGCTSASADQTLLEPGQETYLRVVFDTRKFVGKKESAITVSFNRPARAEVTLRISGYIRKDLVINPGGAQFGSIAQGEGARKLITIQYAGRSNWAIEEVVSRNPFLEASLTPLSQRGGRIDYELTIRVLPDAPTGYLRDQVWLRTNDRKRENVPVRVEAKIEPSVVVNPANLFLGVLKPGDKVTRPVVIRARQPFRVTGLEQIEGADSFRIEIPLELKAVHVIPVTFTANDIEGRLAGRFRVLTDLKEHPELEFQSYVQVSK